MLSAVQNNTGPPAAFFAGFLVLWLVFAAVFVASLVFAVFCIIDIVRRADWQWALAGQQKSVWLLLVILINFLVCPLVMSFIYWFAIRPKLRAVEAAAQAGQYGPGYMTVSGWVPDPRPPFGAPNVHPPGWFPDPGDPSVVRYWDGGRWTAHTRPTDKGGVQ